MNSYDSRAAAEYIQAYNTTDFYFVSDILLVCLVGILYFLLLMKAKKWA